VSGVCVLDYFRTAFGSNPITFDESYYVHYPKLALGHWPPMFYIIQAAWYATFGVTTFSAILLMGVITTAAAVALAFRFMRLGGIPAALLGTGVFLSLPLTGMSTRLVMADIFASLLMLFVIFALSDALMSGRRGLLMAFGLWTIAAVLTKESAATLVIVAPTVIIVTRGKTLLVWKNARRFVLGCCLSAALVLLLDAVTGVLHLRGIADPRGSAELVRYRLALGQFLGAAPAAVLLVAAYGVFRNLTVRTNLISSERRTLTKVAAVWLAVAFLGQLFFRGKAMEPRYFLPACFPLAMLFTEGVCLIRMDIMHRIGSRAAALAAVGALALASIASSPAIKLRQRTGYAEIASSIPYNSAGPVILVSADALGEGAMVVERLLGDSARAGGVLRAS